MAAKKGGFKNLTDKDMANADGKVPPRQRSCTNCQDKHLKCDKHVNVLDKCTNCQKYNEQYCDVSPK
ncbi:hypothetical protein BD410DRAFT_794850, partial [Rickenella mellea]